MVFERSRTYYLYDQPTDMRKSFNTLGALVVSQMQLDLHTGSGFVFINKRRTHLKMLLWEGDGFSLYFKRLERGTFEHPQPASPTSQQDIYKISHEKLTLILQGIHTENITRRKRFFLPKKLPKNTKIAH